MKWYNVKSSKELERELYMAVISARRECERKIESAKFKLKKQLRNKLSKMSDIDIITPHPKSFFHNKHSIIEKLAGIKVTSKNIIASYIWNEDIYGFERTSAEIRTVPEERKGGIIAFSTDVNAIKLSENSIVNWVKQKLESIKNRMLYRDKITHIFQDISKKNDEALGFTIGNFLNGRYVDQSGNVFDEHSLCLNITNIDWDDFYEIARKILVDFKQESVLIKDDTLNEVSFMYGDMNDMEEMLKKD